MWKREMGCLLSVCDYIVEFIPSSQNFPEGTTLEVRIFSLINELQHPRSLLSCFQQMFFTFQVMTSVRRSDICINLPALQKLDAMLLVRFSFFSPVNICSKLLFCLSCVWIHDFRNSTFLLSFFPNFLSFTAFCICRTYWGVLATQNSGMLRMEICHRI